MKKVFSLGLTGVLVGLALSACGPTNSGADSGTDAAPAEAAAEASTGNEGGTGNEAGAGLSCDTYCTAITANCSGANQQYASMQQCLATCTKFPMGTVADMAGNTAGCRQYHAAAAATGVVHCPHAGPAGDGVCGANCASFCALAMTTCPTAFTDAAACMTACAAFPMMDGHYTSMGSTAGNTFNCRMYHLTAAAADPATHCGHIVTASPVCM